jgi:hypothetical protein
MNKSFDVHLHQPTQAELPHPVPLRRFPKPAQGASGSIQTLRLRIAFL